MAVGISMITRIQNLSPVILSLILGAMVGEWIGLEELLEKMPAVIGQKENGSDLSLFIEKYTGVLIILCTGSLGLVGAMTEGMTGNGSLLITKSILDIFGAMIFSLSLGASVSCIAVPQLVLYLLLFGSARLFMPLVTETSIADFMGCGGVIALMAGFRVAEIKKMKVGSVLPALVFVMPVCELWKYAEILLGR